MSQETSEKVFPDDIAIIWLDESITDFRKQLELSRKTNLLSLVKSIRPFIDASICYEHIQKTNDVRTLLIVSGSLGETFLPSIHELTQITFVYILCFDIEKHKAWAKQWSKIRGVYNDVKSFATKLHEDLRVLAQTNLPFGLFESGQRSLKDLTSEQASFMWSQLITEVLLRLPQTSDAKAEMIAECRSSYKDNRIILDSIDDFEKNYQSNQAIEWYTKNTFVFQLFNRAFRRQDFEVIFKYRYFLLDLYKGIHSLHTHQYHNKQGRLTVHRGQTMFKHELMKLKQSVGQLISINTFFSTSATQTVAVSFSGNGEYQSQGIVSVMFEIELDLSVASRTFALIENLSVLKDERETLFSMGHIFRVESVELETDTIWLVTLVWDHAASNKLKEMEQLTDLVNFYTGQHIGERPSIVAFGYFLSETGLLRQAMRFYLYLSKTLPPDHPDRGILYNNLGEVLRRMNYVHQARRQFEKAIECCTDTFSIQHPLWAIIYSNIGLLNLTCKKPKEALKCYRCAAFILSFYTSYSTRENQIYTEKARATVYYGMAAVFMAFSQEEKAKYYHEKALHIELDILPKDHPTLIESYHELGDVSMRLEKDDEALKNYETALRIAQNNLLPNDQRCIILHVKIASLAFYAQNDASKTLEHCLHAQQIIEQTASKRVSASLSVMCKTLFVLYFHLNLLPLAVNIWGKYLEMEKQQLVANNDDIDLSKVITQVHHVMSQTDSKSTGRYLILHENRSPSIASTAKRAAAGLCEFADQCRASGYTTLAIECYLHLLDLQPASGDSHFDQVHRSRLHNNLAACYRDLNDNGNALRHFHLSLSMIKPKRELLKAPYNLALYFTILLDCISSRMNFIEHENIFIKV